MEQTKTAYAETTHIVMSEDINQLGNLHGGTLMQWVDIIGAVAATRHAHSTVTTAALDSMDFKAAGRSDMDGPHFARGARGRIQRKVQLCGKETYEYGLSCVRGARV